MTINIHDWGREEYLDGAMMQYSVIVGGEYPNGNTVAYCKDIETARALAIALSALDDDSVVITKSK